MPPPHADRKKLDPALWRPVSLAHDPDDFAYLVVEEVTDSELTATVFRWPRVGDDGRLELRRHCALRAAPTGGLPFAFNGGPSLIDRRNRLNFSSPPTLSSGEIAAVRIAGDGFWERQNDLADWGRLSLPLVKLTDEYSEVAKARFQPIAWTLWRDWLGQAPLIAHLGRLGQELISTETRTPATVSFETRIDDDAERFFDPDIYLEKSTPQALERPDSVIVHAGDEQLWMRLSVARREDRERDWLKNSVLLEAGSAHPDRLEQVVEVHDRLAAAVRRGEPRWGAEKSSTSIACFRPLDDDGKPQEIPGAWRARAERRASRSLALVVGSASSLIAAFSQLGWIWAVAFGAAAGLFIGAVFTVWPGVEFTARRSERITRFALKGVLAPLVGAGGAVLFRAISEGKGPF